MKPTNHFLERLALAFLLTATVVRAEWTFETNFNDDIPAGTEVYGTTVVEWIDDDGEDGVRRVRGQFQDADGGQHLGRSC
jgi:hypothetical protein